MLHTLLVFLLFRTIPVRSTIFVFCVFIFSFLCQTLFSLVVTWIESRLYFSVIVFCWRISLPFFEFLVRYDRRSCDTLSEFIMLCFVVVLLFDSLGWAVESNIFFVTAIYKKMFLMFPYYLSLYLIAASCIRFCYVLFVNRMCCHFYYLDHSRF